LSAPVGATTGAFVTHLGRIRKKGTLLVAKFPLFIVIVPLKLFFVGHPRERISSVSGVPKGRLEPPRVSPPPPQGEESWAAN